MAKIQSLRGVAGKETVYVDVDDEITAIIDKVQLAKSKVVALVLPKRSPVLQSIVNMKLLKRTADTADKNLVLVTGEAGLMPLAGAVGLHVASTPTSKPSIPSAPAGPSDEPEDADAPLDVVDGNADDDFDPDAAANKTIGELAGTSTKIPADGVDESIDMTDDADEAAEDAPAAGVLKFKKNSKLRVPNFDSFRKKLALGLLAVVVLVVGWVYAFMVMPHATITIHTDSSTIKTNLNLVLDTAAKVLDAANSVVPATAQSQQKTATQQASATGQQNNGDKATGTVTLTNCNKDSSPVTIPAGTTISSNGHTFVLQSSAALSTSLFNGSGVCQSLDGFSSKDVTVHALNGGADYNIGPSTFSLSGYASVQVKSKAAMGGGTDDIVKIVTQSDIDGATAKIKAADASSVKQLLTTSLSAKGLLPVPSTFAAGDPQVSSNAKAGDTADSVTVTAITTYTMLGVQKSDLQKLVIANVDGQLDKGKQVILDDGVANATYTQANPATATGANVAMAAESLAGPHLDVAQLKTQLVGKKSGDIKSFIRQTPGVTSVDVKFSPAWVSVVPKDTQKVTITIVKAGK